MKDNVEKLLRGPMSVWKSGLAFAGLAFTPLAVMGFVQGSDAVLGKAQAHEPESTRTEGSRREAVLAGLARIYVSRGGSSTAAMRNGKVLAPISFLNLKLKEMKMGWRVESTEDVTAETYEIS